MGLTNNLKKQVDMPVWEWCRFAPTVSSSLSSSCTADNSNFNIISGRYIYYTLALNSFWRYDTWADSYEQLSSPLNGVVTSSSMRYSGATGYYGRVISAPSTTTIQTGLPFGRNAVGFKIRIVSGTGAGQERYITSVADPVVADFGAASAAGTTTTLIDTTKFWGTGYVGATWNVNNWVGYTVRVTLGTGLMQTRKILYNSANTITIGDVTKQPEDPWCHTTWTASGIGSQYQIESSVITVDTAWSVTPDNTSRYVIQSGGVFLLSMAGATPWFTLQYYDVLADTWYVKPALTNMISAAATDISLERMTENSTIWTIGISSAVGTTTTLTDSTGGWTVNQWAGYYLYIYTGTGVGQLSKITSNTATILTFATVTTAPDITSRYEILGYDAGIAASATYNSITDSTKTWTVNQYANFGVRIVSGTGAGQMRQVQSNTSTTLSFYCAWNITPDATSVYSVQGDSDTMYFAWGGSSEIFKYRLGNLDTLTHGRILDSGVASTLSCYLCDANHTIFEQGAISITTITFSSTTATATTANPHSLKVGQYVSIHGATGADATYYDGLHQIVTVPTYSTFTFTTTSTPSANAVGVGAQTTTALFDSTKDYRQTTSGGTSGQSTITFSTATPTNINGWYVAGTGINTVGSTYCQVVSGAGTTTLTLSVANSGTVSGLIVFNQWAPAATGTASSGTSGTVTVTMSGATPSYINGWYASGTGIGTGAYVVSGAGTSSLVMSGYNSAAVSGIITFSQSWNPATLVVGNTGAVTITTGSAAGQAIQIASQTGNSLTFPAAVTAYTAGTTRYAIVRRDMIGATTEGAFNPSYNSSIATTTGSTTVLTDTSASITATASSGVAQASTIVLSAVTPANLTGWYASGTGIGVGTQVVSGAGTTTLTLSVPNSATVSGTITFSAWYTNSLVGKRLKLLTSSAQGNVSEQTITGNTPTTITVGAAFTGTPIATTAYSILAAPARGTGIELQWASGMSDPARRGKYFFCARGGATVGFDRLDMTTDRWNLMYSAPAFETLTTGSMYAYDGGDRMYFTKETTQRVYYVDLSTNWIHGAGIYPYVAGSPAILGNRMEIFTTTDGLKYLWLNRHSNVECFKQLLFY